MTNKISIKWFAFNYLTMLGIFEFEEIFDCHSFNNKNFWYHLHYDIHGICCLLISTDDRNFLLIIR
jgi:hypothetical protein